MLNVRATPLRGHRLVELLSDHVYFQQEALEGDSQDVALVGEAQGLEVQADLLGFSELCLWEKLSNILLADRKGLFYDGPVAGKRESGPSKGFCGPLGKGFLQDYLGEVRHCGGGPVLGVFLENDGARFQVYDSRETGLLGCSQSPYSYADVLPPFSQGDPGGELDVPPEGELSGRDHELGLAVQEACVRVKPQSELSYAVGRHGLEVGVLNARREMHLVGGQAAGARHERPPEQQGFLVPSALQRLFTQRAHLQYSPLCCEKPFLKGCEISPQKNPLVLRVLLEHSRHRGRVTLQGLGGDEAEPSFVLGPDPPPVCGHPLYVDREHAFWEECNKEGQKSKPSNDSPAEPHG